MLSGPGRGVSGGPLRQATVGEAKACSSSDNREDMSSQAIQFINDWLYDIERFLRRRLDALKDDLESDDGKTQQAASKEAERILDWLDPPLPPRSSSARLERAKEVSQSNELSIEEKVAAVGRALRSTGRRRGRPRDETSQLAIRALGLHLAGMSWREIAMRLKGCAHTQPMPPMQRARKRNPNLSCEYCSEAIRNAAFRLRRFLKQLDYPSDLPDGKSFSEESRRELLELWGIKGRN